MDRPELRRRFSRATLEALYASPVFMVLGWLSPEIYGCRLTLPRALCALAALVASEMLVDERQPVLQRELQVLALGLVVSFGLAALVGVVCPGMV